MKKKLWIFIICIKIFFLTAVVNGEAINEKFIEKFSWEVIYPETQSEKDIGYYHLLLNPGRKETIKLELKNSSSDDMNVVVKINSAKTNEDGVIEYGSSKLKIDDSLANPTFDIVKGPSLIYLPGNKVVTVEFQVTAPLSNYEGTIAGGIELIPEAINKVDIRNQEVVSNKFTFVIGILVVNPINKVSEPVLKMNKVYQSDKMGVQTLGVNVSNIEAVIIDDMIINVQVRRNNKKEILFEVEKKKMRMAPNSMIDFPILLQDKNLSTGLYTVQTKITTGEKEWSWSEDVEITNKNTVEKKSTETSIDESKVTNRKSIKIILLVSLTLTGGVIINQIKKKMKGIR